ncbi:MAG: CopG-like 1 or ribbon-helix-helix domain, 5, partial [Cyanobacteriota bacterium]
YRALQHRGADEGRSISNMASYLLERTLLDPPLSST